MQTCKNLIEKAFAACDSGIDKAQSQCLGVMSELGNVYHHARDVLDRINPQRWAGGAGGPRTQQQQQQQEAEHPARVKRQLPADFSDIDSRHR